MNKQQRKWQREMTAEVKALIKSINPGSVEMIGRVMAKRLAMALRDKGRGV